MNLKGSVVQNRYTLVESFSGPGGLSLGLEKAGFELLFAFDLDEKAVETHNHNLGGRCERHDASKLTGPFLLEKLQLAKGDIDLFSGGPPCQGFSKQKRGAHLGDKRNLLVLEFARLIKETLPKFFLFENVAIAGKKRGRGIVDVMFSELSSDYQLVPGFYNAADFGLAQTRERFVTVGRRLDLTEDFRPPSPTVERWTTVGDVLSGLPEPPEDYSEHPDFANHQNAKVSQINIERFSHVPQGGGWKDIPYELRLKCHQKVDSSKGGWPDVYGRLEWSGQCPTITGGFDSFTRGRYGHPLANRPLTPREAARIQGFPDTFVFKGTRGNVRSQIGNAVPPPLATAIGREIRHCLDVFYGKASAREREGSREEQLLLF